MKSLKNYSKIPFLKLKSQNFIFKSIVSKQNLTFVKWKMTFIAFGKQQKILGLSEIITNKQESEIPL